MDNMSSSSESCMADMLPPKLICEYNMVYLSYMAKEKLTKSRKLEGVVIVW